TFRISKYHCNFSIIFKCHRENFVHITVFICFKYILFSIWKDYCNCTVFCSVPKNVRMFTSIALHTETFVYFINCFRLISWFRLFFVTAIVLSLVIIVIILTVSGIIAVLAVFRTVVFLAVIILTAIGFVTIPRPITVIRFFLRRLFLRWFFSVLSSSDLLIIFSCFSYIAMNIRNFQFN